MAEQSKTRVSVGTFQGGIELEFDDRKYIIGVGTNWCGCVQLKFAAIFLSDLLL